jgi:pheromone shutdown protein TraB
LCLPQKLAKLAADNQNVVAVVGAAHILGISAHFPGLTLFNHISGEAQAKVESGRKIDEREVRLFVELSML